MPVSLWKRNFEKNFQFTPLLTVLSWCVTGSLQRISSYESGRYSYSRSVRRSTVSRMNSHRGWNVFYQKWNNSNFPINFQEFKFYILLCNVTLWWWLFERAVRLPSGFEIRTPYGRFDSTTISLVCWNVFGSSYLLTVDKLEIKSRILSIFARHRIQCKCNCAIYLCRAFIKSSKCRNFGFASYLMSSKTLSFSFGVFGSEFISLIKLPNNLCCIACSRFVASAEYISNNANTIIGISSCKSI